jgi:hypothetical protein
VLKRVIWLFVAFPVAALLVTLALANRQRVQLILDPFRPERPVLSLEMPFYAFLFVALILGVVLGGIAAWFAQAKWRRTARTRALEALRWQAEADRLARERDRNVTEARALAATSR